MSHTGVHRWRLPAILGAITLIAAGCTGPAATHRTATAADTPPAVPATASASTAPTVSAAAPGGAADAPCTYKLIKTDLPTWARAGFHGPPFNTVPYVTSSGGDIVAVLFGYPLQAPPVNVTNKILWVPTDLSAGKLTVDAHLVGTSETVDISGISKFGPSYDDVPKPGCWRFTLHWKGQAETVDIVYREQ